MTDIVKTLIPKPQKVEDRKELVKIAEFNKFSCDVVLSIEGDIPCEAKNLIKKKLYDICVTDTLGSYKITLKTDSQNPAFKDIDKNEAYFIDISETEAVLCGIDEAGLFYAATTLVQMLSSKCNDIFLPKCYILDWPSFEKRGHFVESRYGSEFFTLSDWYDFVDYMASMKLNRLTIGVYGCWGHQYDNRKMEYIYVPIKKYPELKTPKNSKYYSVKENKWVHEDDIIPPIYNEDLLGKIIAYGKKKNVLVKPLFNSLGHNTLLPAVFPEISAKEDDGTPKKIGFCTNNDKTYEVLFNIYDEIIERYLKPNEIYDFHIGLDEVGESYICRCEKCRDKEHSYLMTEHIIKLCKHLKEKGMKHVYIYHDMLYQEFDIINEKLKERFISEGIYDVVVIDWWSYEDPVHLFYNKADGVNNIFHSVIKPDTGYYHWAIPTENNENIRACALLAKKLSFEGIESYSSMEYCYDKNYLTLADVSWNDNEIEKIDEFNERYACKYYPEKAMQAAEIFNGLHNIMKDETRESYINRACFKLEYYFYGYRNKQTGLPKDFPGGVYKLIAENEKEYTHYLKFLKENAAPAVEFFVNSGNVSLINSIWLLTSKHYYALSDEYLTIYSLYKDYNSDKCDAAKVINELERLISQREKLMLLAEEVRIPPNRSTYLRNMSVFRQYMLDLRDYFKKTLEIGKKPKLDVMDLSYAMSSKFEFLR